MKSAALERQSGQYAVAISLLLKGIDAFPSFDKFWMMLGQIYECHIGDMQKARLAYAQGVRQSHARMDCLTRHCAHVALLN